MFMKFGTNAIINISEVASITKACHGEELKITLKNGNAEPIIIPGEGRKISDRIADVERMYNFAWESICEWRRAQPNYDGIKVYVG